MQKPPKRPIVWMEGAAKYGRSSRTAKYGQYYWCVQTMSGAEIFVSADRVETREGALLFLYNKDELEEINLMLAPGQWTAVYAASCFDGSAVAIEHWDRNEDMHTNELKQNPDYRNPQYELNERATGNGGEK